MDLLELLRQLAAESTNAAGSAERIAELRARIVEARNAPDADPIDLAALDAAAMEAFESARGAGVTPESLATMAALADICDAVRALAEADQAEADEREQAAAALAARVAGDQGGDGSDGDGDQGGEPGDQAATDAGAADTDAGADDSAPAGATPSPAGAEPALVASAGRPARVPLSALPNQRRRTPAGRRHVWKAASDIHGVTAGSEYRNVEQLVRATVARLGAFGRTGGVGQRNAGIAMIDRTGVDPTFTINSEDVSIEMLDQLTDESRLPGGALVAAGGWCAPSEILYDLLPGADPSAGMVDLPTITTRRGGVRWPATPQFSALYADANTTFRQTEATVIAGVTPKPCYEIGCTTFGEVRLDVTGVCVRSPILTERGYPELVRSVLNEIMAVHAHKVNQSKIADMVAGSTANTIAEADPVSAGYTASLLMAIELQVEYLRYRHRWSPSTTLEAVIPLWARGSIRSDLAARNGQAVDAVTDAQIDAHLRARGISPQWVYDWQDSFATGVAGDFGGTTLPKKYPTAVTILIYRAGTYFLAQNDVITIDGLYDAALLAANMHLALFTEEGIKIGKRDWPSIALTVPVCPGGVTGGQVVIDCIP